MKTFESLPDFDDAAHCSIVLGTGLGLAFSAGVAAAQFLFSSLFTMTQSCQADFGTTIVTGLSSWLDTTGNNHTFVQATTTKQPSMVAATLNGMAVPRGDGVDDCMTSNLTLPSPGTTPTYRWAIARQVTWASGKCLFGDISTGTSYPFLIGGVTATPTLQAFRGTAATSVAAVLNRWVFIEGYQSNTTNDFFNVGYDTTFGVNMGNLYASTGVQAWLNSGTGNTAGNWDIAAFGHASSLPTDAQRGSLRNKADVWAGGANNVACPYPPRSTYVMPMIGQSNCGGLALTSGLSAPNQALYQNVRFCWNVNAAGHSAFAAPLIGLWGPLRVRDFAEGTTGGTHGCEISYGRDLDAASKSVSIAKWCASGQPIQYFIDNWSTITAELTAMKAGSTAAWGPLLWLQGENDAVNSTLANNYAAKLTELAVLWRTFVGDANARIIIAGINLSITAGTYPNAATVASQQASWVAGDVNAKLIPDGTGGAWTRNADGVHNDSATQLKIGSAAAALAFV